MAQVIEGTWDEVKQHEAEFAGHTLRVIIDPEEDLAAGIPAPPFTVRNQAHLEELLLAGLNSPAHEVTPESWEQRREEVYRRRAERQQR